MNRLASLLLIILVITLSSCRKEPQPLITSLTYEVLNCSPPYMIALSYNQDPESVADNQVCEWTFADGSTEIECGTTFITINDPGTYKVKLTISNEDKSASREVRLELANSYAINSSFNFSTEDTYQGCSVSFTNTSTHATSYMWYFGDGDSAATRHAEHRFPAEGTYTVTMVASCNGQSQSSTADIHVYDNPSKAFINRLELHFPDSYLDSDQDDRSYLPDYYVEVYVDANYLFRTPLYEDINAFPQIYYFNNTSTFLSGNHTVTFRLMEADWDNADDFIGDYQFTTGYLRDNCYPNGVWMGEYVYCYLSY